MASRLQSVAAALSVHGFEAALAGVKHNNATGRVPARGGFDPGPPCCKVLRPRGGPGATQPAGCSRA